MIEIVCICVSIISMACCIVCVTKLKGVESDRDKYYGMFLECHGDMAKTLVKWNETIEICQKQNCDIQTVNSYNRRLIDINADLRLELNKMKENNNA